MDRPGAESPYSRDEIQPPQNAATYATVIMVLSLSCWIGSGMTMSKLPSTQRLWIAYCLPIAGCVLLGASILLFRSAKSPMPVGVCIVGWLVVAGGAAFDIFATLYHTPDLVLERNPIVLLLFREGHGLTFVYAYAALGQFAFVCSIGMLWTCLLRHREEWLGQSMRLFPKSCGEFVKFSLSGRRISWFWFLVPFGKSGRKNIYCIFWVVVPLLMGLSAHRWYLGLAWFRWIDMKWEMHFMAGGPGLGLLAFLLWLCVEWRRRRPIRAGVRPADP